MAKNYSQLLGVMEILKEVLKLPLRNKKIFLRIILNTMIPCPILILVHIFTIEPFSINLDLKNPESLKLASPFILGLVFVFLLVALILVKNLVVATIYASAMSYLGRDLTVKELSLKIQEIWTRPMITGFYFSLLNTGYVLLILPICFVVIVERGSLVVSTIGIVLLLLAVFLNIYLVLVWMLSLVTSVLEDCFGLQALGKAEKLVKGRKVVGLVLTFLLMILMTLFGAIFLVSMINKKHQTEKIRFAVMYITLSLAILVKILSMMVYTVFYFERKQSHGEQVEVEVGMDYRRSQLEDALFSALSPGRSSKTRYFQHAQSKYQIQLGACKSTAGSPSIISKSFKQLVVQPQLATVEEVSNQQRIGEISGLHDLRDQQGRSRDHAKITPMIPVQSNPEISATSKGYKDTNYVKA